MPCEPCQNPGCSAGCGQVVTPEGLLCQECARDLAAGLRAEEDADR